ncbi:hypothetical protein THAOC_15670, partial [Thalassiosira oceanica]
PDDVLREIKTAPPRRVAHLAAVAALHPREVLDDRGLPPASGSDRLVDLLTPRRATPRDGFPAAAASVKRFRAEALWPDGPARERADDEAARAEDRADEAAAESTDRTAAAAVDLPLRLLLRKRRVEKRGLARACEKPPEQCDGGSSPVAPSVSWAEDKARNGSFGATFSARASLEAPRGI